MPKQTQSINMSGENILKALDDRIEMLQNIKIAIRYAWGIETMPAPLRGEEASVRQVQHERQQRDKTATPKQAARKSGTGNRDMILAVLRRAGGPLSPPEVFIRMMRSGWETTSTKPKELVGVTLRSMWEKGQLNRVGGDYELPKEQREQQRQEEQTLATPTEDADSSSLIS